MLKQSEPSQWHWQIRSMAGVTKSSLTLPPCLGHNDSQKAARVNEHFANICNQLPSLDWASLPSYLPPLPPPIIHAHQVYNVLRRLNASKAAAPGDIPIKLIKEFAMELSEPLSVIFNAILHTGNYPSSWKRAVITPIPKKQQVSQLSDLRPISITAIFSRVMETFICRWVTRDLSPVIDQKQFGNVAGSSTSHYLISLFDTIGKNLDRPGHCASLCAIDFAKAFDNMNHNVVIGKLINYGVQPALIPAICSFLNERKQAVRVGSSISCDLGVTCGVPQGTKLGPVIFLVMINDALSEFNHRWKYVDDLSVVEIRRANEPSTVQLQLDSLVQWCESNDMKPNPTKCCVMNISFVKQVQFPKLQVADTSLSVVDHLTLLGVHLQADLKWDINVSAMVSKASRRLYIVYRLRKCRLATSDLVAIYAMYIRPVLEYASPVWSSSLTTAQSNDIERVQKRFCRVILGGYDSYRGALDHLRLDSLHSRRESLLLSFASDLLTSALHRDFLPKSRRSLSGRQLRNSHLLHEPKCRTTRYYNSSIPSIVRILNRNPDLLI